MNNKFSYTDEDDKCYGLSGMVISLNVLDSDDMLREISIEADHGESISFTPDFFFCSNPRYSAKIAWNEMLKQYQLLTGLVVGNIMCRYTVQRHKPLSSSLIDDMKALIQEEGKETCSLEDDEIDMIFDKTLSFMRSVYANPQVHAIACGIADAIKQRRTMSGSEVLEEMQMLRRR